MEFIKKILFRKENNKPTTKQLLKENKKLKSDYLALLEKYKKLNKFRNTTIEYVKNKKVKDFDKTDLYEIMKEL